MRGFSFFFLFLFLYLLTTPGHLYTWDSEISYYTTHAIVVRGDLRVPDYPITVRDAAGNSTGRYGLLQAILCLPIYCVGLILDWTVGKPDFLPNHWRITMTTTFNQWVGALGLVLFLKILVRLGCSIRPAFAMTLVFGFASPWWTYSRDLFRQPLGAVLILWCILEAVKYREHHRVRNVLSFGLSLGLSVTNRITSIVTWPGLLLLLITPGQKFSRGRIIQGTLLLVTTLALGIGLQIATNYYRFGDWWGPAYESRTFGFHVLRQSLPEFFISPGRGLLLFAPPLLFIVHAFFSIWKSDRWLASGLALTVLSKLALYCLYDDFRGGVNPGPRYLLPIIPVMFLMVALFVCREWNDRVLRSTGLVLAGIGFIANGFNSLIHYQPTLTFWDQLLRALGFPNYEQWPAFDASKDFYDILIGRWIIDGRWGVLAAYLALLTSGILFSVWRIRSVLNGTPGLSAGADSANLERNRRADL